MIKKILSLILLICITMSVLCIAACNGTDNNGDENVIDLYEMEFKIMQIASMTTGKGDPMFYLEGTKAADTAIARLDSIGKKYNCVITIYYPDSDDKATSTLISNMAVGNSEYSIISSGKSNKIFALAESECLYPLLDLNDILEYGEDTFAIYGPPNLLEPAMYKGQLYMVTPFAHPGKQLRSGGFIVFKEDVVSEATGLDLREYSEKGYWTWDAFVDVAKKCTLLENGAAVTVGASLSTDDFVEEAVMSNGTSFIQKTNDGYTASVKTSNLSEALTWVKMLNDELSDYIVFEGQSIGIEKLATGNAAMLFARAQAIKNEVAYKVANFGILPFPYGPQGNPETNDTPVFIEGIGIFSMAEDPTACALIIKEYCQPFDEYPDEESLYKEDMLLLWDERDLNVMLQAAQRGSFDYYPCDGTKITLRAAEQLDFLSPSKLIESYSGEMEEIVTEYIIPNKELIDTLLGE